MTTEYQVLRQVILTALLRVPSTPEIRRLLIEVNRGLDFATAQAIHAYAGARDTIRKRFISILGHELRNPLNAVLLGASAINAAHCSQPKHASIAWTMQRSAERMQRMVGDVIDFAQAHLGHGIPAIPVACDLGGIAAEAAHEMRLGHPDRDLVLETRGDLAGSWDHDRVLQALSNLISNSVQQGSDPIRVGVFEHPDQLAVITRVTNRGATIPPDLIGQLFEPFGPRRGTQARRSGLAADRARPRWRMLGELRGREDHVRDRLAARPRAAGPGSS